MITTRDIKVFIFSIFITTLCLALFNNDPIKEAEAQGGMPPMGAPGMAPPGGDTYDLLQAHITGAVANLSLIHISEPIKEAEAQGGMPPTGFLTGPPGEDVDCSLLTRGQHPCYASKAHAATESALDEVLEKLDTLLAR